MSINRTELPFPSNVGILDYNGSAAFAHYGLTVRDYPGLVPSVDTAIEFAGEKNLVLQPWQNELHFHAELAVVIGRDVAPREGEGVVDALLGYSLGLGIWDDSVIEDLKYKRTRDVHLARDYGYLMDGNRQQGKTIIGTDELSSLNGITLTLNIPGYPAATYPQKDLMFDGPRVIRECNKLIAFRRGDIICLGPVAAPIVVGPKDQFPPGTVIRVEGPPFEPIEITVEDRRDPDTSHPWPGCEIDFISRYPHLR
jgi:2-keto-4-pentenoate hydratase/2-oxohepta-3-ene-1,7-dioic acid hydratase in catechol pathway